VKQLIDGSQVPARLFYYLLDFKDLDTDFFFQKTFFKQQLCTANKEEFYQYFEYATKKDLERLKEGKS